MTKQRMRAMAVTTVVSAGFVGAAFAGSVAASDGPANAAQAQPPAASGRFSLVMMIHTSSGGFGNLPNVQPWNGAPTPVSGRRYRSIPCVGNAPVNNIASDLPSYGTRVQGSRAPSSMRAHPFSFRVRRNARTRRMEMLGTIRFTVCKLGPGPTPRNDPVPDARKPKIFVSFRATFKRETAESLRWAGRFRITGGTQRYQDLTGEGEIAGYFMCFAPAGCAASGNRYLDGQFTMQGAYRDPTPRLAAS